MTVNLVAMPLVIVVGTPMVGLEIVNYTPCVSKN